MKRIFLASIVFLLVVCATPYVSGQSGIIPKPAKMENKPGKFLLDKNTRIYLNQPDPEVKGVIDDFRSFVQIPLGFEIKYADKVPKSNCIIVAIDQTVSNTEAYQLKVLPEKISVTAKSAIGVFYALQTIRQLCSFEIESKAKVNQKWEIPAVEIEDYPRFEYRGFMLDVARHFQPIDVLKRYVDLLAFYKMNYFHLHLTDDQGWRIEIKGYPELQKVSAWRKETMVGSANGEPRKYDGIRHGGYYTQEQLKELVKYAKKRFITIVPEIELPGHSTAALAAYPELACFPKKFEVKADYGVVFDDVYCTKESTFKFLEDVLSEVVEIFPGKLIHIGGDECPKVRWKSCPQCQQRMKLENLKNEDELQSYFIKRIQKFLIGKGRNIIGWDEIVEGGLAPGATLMYWRTMLGEDHIVEAAKSNFKIIMAPFEPYYFNVYEDKERELTPLAWEGLTPLQKVYNYNPVPSKLTGKDADNIVGVQANLWSEYVKNDKTAEYMTFPRLCALAETAWSPKELKDYDDFIHRLNINSKHLDMLDVNYSKYFIK